MFPISPAATLRAVPRVISPFGPPALPSSHVATGESVEAPGPAQLESSRAGMSYDGPGMDGLQRAVQSVTPSLLARLGDEDGGLAFLGYGPSGETGAKRPSVLERAYEWCDDTVRQFLGGPAATEPPAWSTERYVGGGVEPRRDGLAGQAGTRVRRGADEDFLASVIGNPHPGRRVGGNPAPTAQPARGGARGRVSDEDLLASVIGNRFPGRRVQGDPAPATQPARGGAIGGISDENFLVSVIGNRFHGRRVRGDAAPARQPARGGAIGGVSDEDFLVSLIGNRHSGPRVRGDPAAATQPARGAARGEASPSRVSSTGPTLRSVPARAVGVSGGARTTLDGGVGSFRVRIGLPVNSGTLTIKVSREGEVAESAVRRRYDGTGGVAATVLSGAVNRRVADLANCQPIDPQNIELGCSIPVHRGRVDGKRFVTLAVEVSSGGAPILLEFVSRPA